MKNRIAIVALISVVFISCGRRGWSCKKRYCTIEKTKTLIENDLYKQNCAVVVGP